MTRTVFVIPAKRESIRAPGKNRSLFGRALVAALDAAESWQDVLVSTDDEELGALNGPVFVYRRGPELSKPDVSATAASLAAINHYTVEDEDTIVQMLPTSPFRTGAHITEALELYGGRDPNYSAVLSVTPIHGRALCFEGSDGLLQTLNAMLPTGYRDGRWGQAHPIYISNGAIQITSAKLLRMHGDFWQIPKKIAYVMDEYAGFDVDSQAQLDMAQAVIASEEQ